MTLLAHDLRIGLLLTLIFWIVRSTGETTYLFMQQFLEPRHSPHDIKRQFGPMRYIFGSICPQKSFILMQITFQMIDVVAIACLILTLMNWQTLPVWIA